MENSVIIQKLKPSISSALKKAEMYYSILSVVNNLKLTPRQVQLIAFTAIKGNISYKSIREEFCSLYDSSSATVYNILSELKDTNIFIKENNKIKVNPLITLPFDKDISLDIKLTNG